MYALRRSLLAFIAVVGLYFVATALHKHLDPNKRKSDEQREDAQWIATSKYWIDRQSCRYLGICGLAHYHPDPAAIPYRNEKRSESQEPLVLDKEEYNKKVDWKDIQGGNKPKPGDWDGDSSVLKEVPQYVLDHAPLIHLYSKEQFWPSDVQEHLMHTVPYINHTSMQMDNASYHTVDNLHMLNQKARGKYLFMRSKDDVEKRPSWLGSAYNKPTPYDDDVEVDEDGHPVEEYTQFTAAASESYEQEPWYDPHKEARPRKAAPIDSTHRSPRLEMRMKKKRDPLVDRPGGYSPAPVILVLIDKGNGIVDAFWFYFYSYNLGTTVLNIRFGNHIGDWEHSLIRFYNGVPKAVFFSAHSGGLAYAYDAVEKGKGKGREGRPVLYSAYGSHAMYATPGKHPYVLPFGLLADVTDKGPLWDPAQNYLAYHFNTSITHDADAKFIPSTPPNHDTRDLITQTTSDTLQPALCNPKAPMGWWWYSGRWGDKFYELRDIRQWRFVGQYHYVNGPYGPRFKNLGRSRPCQSSGSCTILESIDEGRKKSWVQRILRRK